MQFRLELKGSAPRRNLAVATRDLLRKGCTVVDYRQYLKVHRWSFMTDSFGDGSSEACFSDA